MAVGCPEEEDLTVPSPGEVFPISRGQFWRRAAVNSQLPVLKHLGDECTGPEKAFWMGH